MENLKCTCGEFDRHHKICPVCDKEEYEAAIKFQAEARKPISQQDKIRDFLENKFGEFNSTHPVIGIDWEDIIEAFKEFLSVPVLPENKNWNEVMVVDEISLWKEIIKDIQAMISSESIDVIVEELQKYYSIKKNS